MAKEMNKTFKYKGYKFNIKVELSYKAERRIGGKVWHKITINNMGAANWSKSLEAVGVGNYDAYDLVIEQISNAESLAKDYVNKRDTRPEIEKELEELGFK